MDVPRAIGRMEVGSNGTLQSRFRNSSAATRTFGARGRIVLIVRVALSASDQSRFRSCPRLTG
jgi:hypothetical protein